MQTHLPNYVVEGSVMEAVFAQAKRVAPTKAPVLITGETGVGKEGVAKEVHLASRRRTEPFRTVHCGALVETLAESELFGHARGSFSGAYHEHRGVFESANSGTVFLDEIGELPLSVQVKLLRVLENGTFCKVGSVKEEKTDVRIVSATNVPLGALVAQKKFRTDLYYRVAVEQIFIPPLRERLSEIPIFVEHFLKQYSEEWHIPLIGITSAALSVLCQRPWQGNVRELRNAIERALLRCNEGKVGVEHLDPPEVFRVDGNDFVPRLLAEVYTEHIQRTLVHCNGNISKTARLLGVNPKTVRRVLTQEMSTGKDSVPST
jgi:DNA-binding NtrC family response regulator